MNFRRYVEYIAVSPMSVVNALVIGAVAGALSYGLFYVLNAMALPSLFCRDNAAQNCGSVPTISIIISLIIAHFLALVALVRTGIIRPLLVVLAAVFTLWGFQNWLGTQLWWVGVLYSAFLFGLAYVYYAWINRLLQLPVALGLTVVSLIIARLLLSNW